MHLKPSAGVRAPRAPSHAGRFLRLYKQSGTWFDAQQKTTLQELVTSIALHHTTWSGQSLPRWHSGRTGTACALCPSATERGKPRKAWDNRLHQYLTADDDQSCFMTVDCVVEYRTRPTKALLSVIARSPNSQTGSS
jgi:hypothetical protein